MGESCGEWLEDGETVTYNPCPPGFEDGRLAPSPSVASATPSYTALFCSRERARVVATLSP
jgi:hypothetical protein